MGAPTVEEVAVAPTDEPLFTAPYLWILATNFFAVFNLNLFILLPSFVRGLGGAEAIIGVLMGTHAVVALVTRFWLGGWLDRYGRRRFIFLGVGLSIVSTTGYFFVDRVGPLLFLCRGLHGFAFACYFTGMLTLTADTVPVSRRTQAIAWTGVAGFAANAIAPPIGEWVLELAGIRSQPVHAYHTLFLFGLGVICCAMVFATRTRPAPHAGNHRGGGVLSVLRYRPMQIVLVPTLAMGIGFGTAFMFIKDFGQVRGLQNVGAFFATYSIVVVCLRVGSGKRLDRVNRNFIIVPSLLILALGVVLQTQLHHPAWLVVLGALCGGGHGLLYPTLASMAYEAVPVEHRGAGMAVSTMGFDAGLALGTLPLGRVAQAFGYPVMFITGAALTLVGLGVYLMLAPAGGRFEHPTDTWPSSGSAT